MKDPHVRIFNVSCLLLPILLFMNGCMGGNYRPVVDPYTSDMSRYEADLQTCQGIAKQQGGVAGEAGKGAVVGAVAGTVIGVALGALAGSPGEGAKIGAAYGGAVGVTQGTLSGVGGQETIIKNCMAGRGYNVLK